MFEISVFPTTAPIPTHARFPTTRELKMKVFHRHAGCRNLLPLCHASTSWSCHCFHNDINCIRHIGQGFALSQCFFAILFQWFTGQNCFHVFILEVGNGLHCLLFADDESPGLCFPVRGSPIGCLQGLFNDVDWYQFSGEIFWKDRSSFPNH